MGSRFIGSTVYVEGRRFDAGTPETEVPDDFSAKIGNHIWVDELPADLIQTEEPDSGVIYQLRQDLSERDAQNSELRKENELLKAEVERSGGNAPDTAPPGVPDEEPDLSSLNHEQLLALANDRGILVDPTASKKQISAALQA